MAVTLTEPELDGAAWPPPGRRTPTVLIGFADALAAPETMWSLRAGGAQVLAFARRGSRPALRHARGVRILEITPPEIDADAAVEELATAIDLGLAQVLMPLDDGSVWLCDAVARRIRDLPLAGPADARAILALDKRAQLEAARAAGFAVPATTVVETVGAVEGLSELPLVLKPALAARRDAHGRLRRGHGWVCGTGAELTGAAREWKESEPLLAQPLIAGVGEGLFGIAGADGIHALSAHRRLRMMNPQGSGSSACRAIAVDHALADAAERMLVGAGWRGLFMLEFLRDRDGTPWFMELNGRTWGSMALARRQGLEYPAWALADTIGERFAFTAPPVPVGPLASFPDEDGDGLVCRHLGRELVHLMMVARGPRSAALSQWPSRRRAVAAVLRIRRDERWYNWNPGDRRVFVADTVQTVLAPLRRHR